MNDTTYRALIRPIPARLSLANAEFQEASKPCEHCSTLVPDRRKAQNGLIKTSYERIDSYPDFPELKASAKVGCGLCRLIRKTIRTAWAVRPMEEWGIGPLVERDGRWNDLFSSQWDKKVKINKASFDIAAEQGNFDFRENDAGSMISSLAFEIGPSSRYPLDLHDQKYGEISQIISFKIFDQQDLQSNEEGYRRRLPSVNALSSSNIKLMLDWIDHCQSSHPTCQVDGAPWLPSRMIDVGPLDGTVLPRLVEMMRHDDIGRGYTALSHMWGDMNVRPPLRLLTSNYDELCSGIVLSSLPQNFLQAIIVTRYLGLRFIWIDSLCIIQDLAKDWKKEAATMHMVYKYAEITIVATSALSTHDGFLERTIPSIPAQKVQYVLKDPTDQRDPSTIKPMFMILAAQDNQDTGTWTGDVEGSTWNTRGWTLQERSLSTRSVHFCKNKMYFECRACRRSEENEPFAIHRPFPMWPRKEPWMMDSGPESIAKRKQHMFAIWLRTVTDYTQRNLTKISDKFPAIQSTAAEMIAVLGLTYVPEAGMWEANMHQELLWQVRDGHVLMPDTYIAPSWSWASLKAKVHWLPPRVLPDDEGHLSIADSIVFKRLDGRLYLNITAIVIPLASISEVDEYERWTTGIRGTLPVDIFVCTHQVWVPKERKFPLARQAFVRGSKSTAVKFAEGRLDLDNADDLTKSSRKFSYVHIQSVQSPSGIIIEQCGPRLGTLEMDEANYSLMAADGMFYRRVGVAAITDKDGRLFASGDIPGADRPHKLWLV